MEFVPEIRWKKYQKLGSGSYGTVYLAIGSRSGSCVAVKSAPDFQRSITLVKEAKFLKELQGNPFIVRCFGVDDSVENGKTVYNMLMEFAPGGTLGDLIKAYRGNSMPESHAAVYSYMLLKGLSHVHSNGLIHCDLKPSNILVFPPTNQTDYCHLKLADFGLSKYVWEKDVLRNDVLHRNRGTQVYASPESISWGLHETATDVWAFGCIVLQMLTARQCKTEKAMWDLFVKFMQESGDVSELGKDFLRRCFRINPDNRWTVDQLLGHPFIVENLKGLPLVGKINCRHNPFGIGDRWIVTRGLFSTPLQIPQLWTSWCSRMRIHVILLPGHELLEDLSLSLGLVCWSKIWRRN